MSCQNHEISEGKVPKTEGLIHCRIQCSQCAWEDDDYQNAISAAKEHHAATGHNLVGETGYSVHIGTVANDRLIRRLAQTVGTNVAQAMDLPDPEKEPLIR